MFTSSRPDGLGSICHSVGTVVNERVSMLGSGTALMSEAPPQPQSDGVITLLASSPLLERSRFSRIRDSTGSYFSEKSGNDGCVSHRLGCSVRGQNSERKMARLATERTHKLSGTVNSVSSIETFRAVPTESPRFGQIGQHNGGGIYKSPRGNTFSPASQSSTKTHCVGLEAFSFITSDSCPGSNECGGISPVPGESSVWRMDSPPSGSEPVVGEVRPSCRRSLRLA